LFGARNPGGQFFFFAAAGRGKFGGGDVSTGGGSAVFLPNGGFLFIIAGISPHHVGCVWEQAPVFCGAAEEGLSEGGGSKRAAPHSGREVRVFFSKAGQGKSFAVQPWEFERGPLCRNPETHGGCVLCLWVGSRFFLSCGSSCVLFVGEIGVVQGAMFGP